MSARGVLPLAAALAALLHAAPGVGDGGLVRLHAGAGPYTVTVFSQPTPLRAGPVDLSVLVQERDGGTPRLDAQVTLRLRQGDALLDVPATRAAATNKLLYAALFTLPAPGPWEVTVTVDGAPLAFTMQAGEAASPLWAFWRYLALPFVALGLYALHQWRRHRGVAAPRRSRGVGDGLGVGGSVW